MSQELADHPHVPIKPPPLYAGTLLVAVLLDWVLKTDLFGWGLQFGLGMVLLCTGFSVIMWAVSAMTSAGTNIPTDRPVTALVTTGPYKYSRNPIYLGLTILYVGLCFLFDLLFGFLFLIPLIFFMNKYVIEREELFLGNKFGGDYIAYFVRTPRWLRKPAAPHED